MRLIYVLAAIVTISVIGCKPKPKQNKEVIVVDDTTKSHDFDKIDTTKRLPDVEIYRPDLDSKNEEIAMRRGGKKPPPPPTDTTLPPPPPPPPAGACLFIDFDGNTVSGTNWNVNGTFVCEPSGVAAVDQQWILDKVKGYYAPFSTVKVISNADSALYWTYPDNKRMRCIVTASYQWYAPNGGIGGVANINSFNWYGEEPCFVFSTLIGVWDKRQIADDVAHELGHTFGNRHQASCDSLGNMISGYNWGNQQWAPIMGASFYSDTALWIIGPTSLGCTVIQNDTAVIFTSLRK